MGVLIPLGNILLFEGASPVACK